MRKLCVIFDLDGTLVDSEGLCNQAFLDLLPALNDSLESLTERYRGLKLARILLDLEQRLQRKLPDGFAAQYRQRVAALFTRELKPMPGVPEMLAVLAFPKCIASSAPPSKIQQALQVSQLAGYFADNCYSSYEVGVWKPAPGLFQYAAQAMGFLLEQCVVIEDSQVGIEAAAAAGMQAFRYQRNSACLPTQAGAEYVFYDMLQLPQLLTEYAKR